MQIVLPAFIFSLKNDSGYWDATIEIIKSDNAVAVCVRYSIVFLEEDMDEIIILDGRGVHFEHDESIIGSAHSSGLEILRSGYLKCVMPTGSQP